MVHIGMSKKCLDAVFELLKKKASRIHAWKGKAKTKEKVKCNSKYLKVNILQ
jgi:hypothetical protein